MTADKLKELREAKSWSQAHLAAAAGLNIRTVQRIEAGEPAASETMLALAAALNVDLSELAPVSRRSPLGMRVAVAAVLATPAALFVTVNLLRSLAGFGAPYELLASAGSWVMDIDTFNLISPVLFIGGAAGALVLTLPALVRFRTKVDGGVLSVRGIDLVARPLALIVAAVAIAAGGALLLYAAAEQVHTPIS